MNRAINHEASKPSQAEPPAGQEMPYWSAYIARLGGQVKAVATTPIWPPEPDRNDSEGRTGTGSHPRFQVRHPSGDRRLTVEQRRKQIAETGAYAAFQQAPAVPQQESRSASRIRYVKREGRRSLIVHHRIPAALLERARHFFANGRARDARRRVVADERVRNPIGDRRTGAAQRRNVQQGGMPRPAIKSLLRTWLDKGRSWAAGSISPEVVAPAGTGFFSRFSFGIWGYYFILKLAMFVMGLIGFHLYENLVFAAFILLPVTTRLLYLLKGGASAVIALSLLYYDSWLPPVGRVFSQASLLSNFSVAYLVELIARFISFPVLGMLAAVWLVSWIVTRWVNMSAIVVMGMLGMWVAQGAVSGVLMQALKGAESRAADKGIPDMDTVMKNFFAAEAQRSVSFPVPQPNAVPFDIIFIHVCSLSWDDVRAVGLEQHPLWRRFDILFEKFNSAASYSGPAAIHLLRATCGQPKHGDMYSPVPEKCYLMNSLLRSGFESELVLNHDGKFDGFLEQVRSDGRVMAPVMPLDGLDAVQRSFDDAPVYDDLSVLDRWLEIRKKSASSRVAMYYNTVSMHDGNHFEGTHSEPNSLETYKPRLSKFLDETESFIKHLEQSGRPAVVVMIPEHGGAVRGDKKQIAGLREIPTPTITLVPVGIKLVGGHWPPKGEPLIIDRPVSYLAVTHIVAGMLKASPFDNNYFSPADYVENLPLTAFVAQNESTTVAEYDRRYYLGRGPGQWEDYTEFNATDAGH